MSVAQDTVLVKTEADEAFLLDVRIRQRRLRLEAEFIELGRDLAEMRDRELYKLLDCETFEAWLASPELSFRRRTAYGLIAAADVCNRLHMTSEQAASIGYVKLEIIRRPILEGKRTPEEWLHDAAALGKEDLKQKVREALGGAAVTSEEDEREEDARIQAGIDAVLRSPVVKVEFGRWSGLRLTTEGRQTLRVWASGGALRVEIE